MNLVEYLMATVTPLYDVRPDVSHSQEYRSTTAKRREQAMIERYRKAFVGHDELSTQEVGRLAGVSKPMLGLRKIEDLGHVQMVRMSADKRGRKQCMWRWK